MVRQRKFTHQNTETTEDVLIALPPSARHHFPPAPGHLSRSIAVWQTRQKNVHIERLGNGHLLQDDVCFIYLYISPCNCC